MTLANFLTYAKYDYKRTDKDTELTQSYNDAILAVSLKMPHGAYKYQSYLSTILSQEDYPLPSTIIHLIHPVKYLEGATTNDSGWPLERLTKQEYDELYPNPNRTSPSTGTPTSYTVFSGSILLGPIPDKTGALIEIDWTKKPTDQSAVGDTPALGDEWREVLKVMTLDRAFGAIGMFEEAQYWRARYEDAEGNPIGIYRDLLSIEKSKEGLEIGLMSINNL